jgi:amino acid permease
MTEYIEKNKNIMSKQNEINQINTNGYLNLLLYETKEDTEEEKELNENLTYIEDSKKGFFMRYFGPIKGGSLRGKVVALASITFGGGCLAFSKALQIMGLGLGLLMFSLIGLISLYTMALLTSSGKKSKILDYNLLVEKFIGKKMLIFTDINNLILCLGIIIGYQKYIYQFLLDILKYFIEFSDNEEKKYELYILLICFLFVQLPLTLMRRIALLQYISIFGSFALIYSILIVCIKTPKNFKERLDNGERPVIVEKISWDYLVSISVFLFGFASHNGIFQIYNELERPSIKRFFKVLYRAFILEFILYFLICVAGYLSFLSNTNSNLLINYKDNDIFIIISKISLSICLHCSMAINYNVMRLSFKSFFLKKSETEFKWYIDILISFITLTIANLIVYNLKSATEVLGIVGGVCCCVICFINPILIYLKVFNFPKKSFQYIFAVFVLIIVNIMGTSSTIYCLYDYVRNL